LPVELRVPLALILRGIRDARTCATSKATALSKRAPPRCCTPRAEKIRSPATEAAKRPSPHAREWNVLVQSEIRPGVGKLDCVQLHFEGDRRLRAVASRPTYRPVPPRWHALIVKGSHWPWDRNGFTATFVNGVHAVNGESRFKNSRWENADERVPLFFPARSCSCTRPPRWRSRATNCRSS